MTAFPEWLRDASPGELRRRVTTLPLERLALGQRLLLLYRLNLWLTAAAQLGSSALVVLLIFAEAPSGRGNPEIVASFLVFYNVYFGYRVLRDLKRAHDQGQRDALTYTFTEGEAFAGTWKTRTATLFTLQTLITFGLLWLTVGSLTLFTPELMRAMNLSTVMAGTLMFTLPDRMGDNVTHSYRLLTGLLRDRERPQRRGQRVRQRLSTLLRSPAGTGSGPA